MKEHLQVICFGDSNTYGYDPRSWLGDRYDAQNRWVDILADHTGWDICNMGVNGREIPSNALTIATAVDYLIVMLGTNDLLQGRGAEESAERLKRWLMNLPLPKNKVFLIVPPCLIRGEWVNDRSLIDASQAYAHYCRQIAQQLDIRFADANEWGISIAYDGVHFTEQGHKDFAAKLIASLL